jgi:Fic family protein
MLYQVSHLPVDYLRVVELMDEMRLRLRFLLQQQPGRWTGLLRRSEFARAIQGSNSIEGFHVTVDDAVAAIEGEEPLIDERTEPWLAVRGYREAMTYILQLSNDAHFAHHEAMLRSLHYMMLSYDLGRHPGRWRPGVIYVRRGDTNNVVYEGPDAALVPSLMDELVRSLNAASSLPIVVRAALAHLNLVMIHPFSDGNGRMARALQTLVLAREGILSPVFSSIEEYLGHNTQEYYQVLGEVGQGSWQPARDPLPWIKFCLTAHYRQAETLLRRSQEAGRLWAELEAAIQGRGLQERVIMALHDAAFGFRVRNTTYRKAAEVSDAVASRDLGQLAAAGLLEAHGEKRGRYYAAGEFLLKLRAETRLAKIASDPFTGEQVREEPAPYRVREPT